MRHPDKEFDRFAEKLVTDVTKAGIGVVSGAAIGIDHMCHSYCVKARGETWGSWALRSTRSMTRS